MPENDKKNQSLILMIQKSIFESGFELSSNDPFGENPRLSKSLNEKAFRAINTSLQQVKSHKQISNLESLVTEESRTVWIRGLKNVSIQVQLFGLPNLGRGLVVRLAVPLKLA